MLPLQLHLQQRIAVQDLYVIRLHQLLLHELYIMRELQLHACIEYATVVVIQERVQLL